MKNLRNITCSYIDTCLASYLTDHHNRTGECLLSLGLYQQTEGKAVQQLLEDLHGSSHWNYDFPENVPDEQLLSIFKEAVHGVDFTPFDASGNRMVHAERNIDNYPYYDPNEEESRAWFVLKWEIET